MHRLLAVGVVTALAAIIEPTMVAVVAGCAVAVVLGGFLVGQAAGALRVLLVGVGGAAVAIVLQLPWSLGAMDGWSAVVGVSSTSGYELGLSQILRFGTGPFGTGLFGWALLVTAVLPLLIGRRWRLGWAVRGWVLAACGFGLAWATGQGWLVDVLPGPDVLLAPAAVGLAVAAGLGMAAFEVDLPDYHFGWRQIVSLLAGAAFVVALLPALGSALSGRWDLPRGDYDRSLGFLDTPTDAQTERVLWIGDASAIPLAGWRLDAPGVDDLGPGRVLTFATSSAGTPTIAEEWAGDLGAASATESALQVAASGGTARLGALLAPMAVRYVVVPLAPAPDPYARDTTYVPSDLLAVLDGQLDLDSVTVNPGVRVYENAAYGPSRALLSDTTAIPEGGEALTERVIPGLAEAPPVLDEIEGYSEWSGPVDQAGQVFVSAAGEGWVLEVDGASVPAQEALGWAQRFEVEQGGAASLRFDTPVTRWLALAGQVLLWAVVLGYLLRVRVREDERLELQPLVPEPTPTPRRTVPAHVVIGADFDDLFGTGPGGDLPTTAVPAVSPDPAPPAADLPTMAVPVVTPDLSPPDPEPSPTLEVPQDAEEVAEVPETANTDDEDESLVTSEVDVAEEVAVADDTSEEPEATEDAAPSESTGSDRTDAESTEVEDTTDSDSTDSDSTDTGRRRRGWRRGTS